MTNKRDQNFVAIEYGPVEDYGHLPRRALVSRIHYRLVVDHTTKAVVVERLLRNAMGDDSWQAVRWSKDRQAGMTIEYLAYLALTKMQKEKEEQKEQKEQKEPTP